MPRYNFEEIAPPNKTYITQTKLYIVFHGITLNWENKQAQPSLLAEVLAELTNNMYKVLFNSSYVVGDPDSP